MQGLPDLNPRDLLKTSRELLEVAHGKPRQANLLRATSTAYYAMFHTLARTCADLLIGGAGSERSKSAWHQVYRALEHGHARNCCKNGKLCLFPKEIQDFANIFVSMQAKRHKADYDPHEKVFKSAVQTDLDLVDTVIDGFQSVPLKDRRAFAAFVLFKSRAD